MSSPKNEYLYNKKELQEETGQYDYGARFYDPVIARWTSVDRYAEKYHDMSPYGYVANNPIKSVDANGDTIIKVNIVDRSGYVHGATSVYIDQSFYGDLKNILAEAGAGTNIYINSSFRTDAKQAELQGDADATTPAPVGNSPHNAGVALDFNLYKDNDVSKGTIKKNSTVTDANEFIKDVKKVIGTRWGGDFKKKDPVHVDKRPGKAEFNKLRDEDQDQMHGDTETKNNDAYIKTTVTLYVLPPDKKKDDKQQ